ncbi:unnamed protein product [Closterium sp. NIES-65]|nr:unnamed protein product [Closterium sp. NIES-65]
MGRTGKARTETESPGGRAAVESSGDTALEAGGGAAKLAVGGGPEATGKGAADAADGRGAGAAGERGAGAAGKRGAGAAGERAARAAGKRAAGALELPAGGQQELQAGGQREVPAGGQQEVPTGGQQEVPAGGQQEAPMRGQQEVPARGQQEVSARGQLEVPGRGQQELPAGGQQVVEVEMAELQPEVQQDQSGNRARPHAGGQQEPPGVEQRELPREEQQELPAREQQAREQQAVEVEMAELQPEAQQDQSGNQAWPQAGGQQGPSGGEQLELPREERQKPPGVGQLPAREQQAVDVEMAELMPEVQQDQSGSQVRLQAREQQELPGEERQELPTGGQLELSGGGQQELSEGEQRELPARGQLEVASADSTSQAKRTRTRGRGGRRHARKTQGRTGSGAAAQQAEGQPGATETPPGAPRVGGQPWVPGAPQGEQQPGELPGVTGAPQGEQQAGGQPRVPGAPQGVQQAGGQPGVPGEPQEVQQAGGQPGVPGAPQGVQQAGGEPGVPRAPQGVQQAGGQQGVPGAPQGVQHAGGQPRVPGAPRGAQQAGGQPGVPGAPQGVQQAGGQPGVPGAPQGVQQAGGQPGVPGAPQGVQQAGGQPGVPGAPQGVQQAGGQPRVPGAPQGVQQVGGQPRMPGAPQGEQQTGGQPGATGASQGEQQLGGQPGVTRAPHGEQQVGEQPGVTGAPQGVQQAGGQSMAPGEPQGVQQGGGQGVQQAGGQPRVLGAPQGEQQVGGQPGVTGAPQGVQQPGGQPRVPWAPQGAQQSGGRSMDDQEQQLEEWCRLLELDTPMATVEESEADEAPPMPPSPCPRFPCDTCFHTFATRGAAANHMRVCRAAEAERRAQALGSIPSLVETDTQERSTPREFGEEAWAGVTSWEWETFFSVEVVGGRTVRRIPQRVRSGVLDALCCILKRLKSQPGDEAATLLLLAFPRLILAMPPKPGIGQKALITERLGAFWEGRWRELFDSAMVAARPAVRPISYTCSDQDPNAIRLSRCRSRCKVGEWSRGLACLIAGELARPSEVMVQSLREKHPASAGKVPQWVRDFTIDTAQPPSLTTDILARAIHTAARASAAGPSGWVTEHLRDTFLTEPSCLSHLLEVFNQWVVGQVPERARPWLAASNLVGLSKPNGDVRPVAIGEQVMEPVTREFKDLLFLSYADDTYILGPAARILEAFGVLRERLEWVGLEVQAHKCRFWEREGKEVERALPLGMQRVDEGLTVVGVPIGEEVWEVVRLRERLRQLQAPLPWLPLLDHPQMASHLLAIAVSARPMYLARTMPPRPEVVEAFRDWDSCLEDCFEQVFPPGTWEQDPDRSRRARIQLHLPVRLGGFGIRAAASLSPLSYVCGWAQAARDIAQLGVAGEEAMFAEYLTTSTGAEFLDPWFVKALEQLPATIRHEIPGLPLCVAAPPVRLFQARQRQLAVEELQALRRLARDDATLARFTSLQGPGAGAWVSAVPAHSDLTFTAAEWGIAAAIRLGLPIQQLQVAGRCVCGTAFVDPADPHHALRCRHQHGPSRVHDEVKFALAKISKASEGVVTMEDSVVLHGKRVDVAVLLES